MTCFLPGGRVYRPTHEKATTSVAFSFGRPGMAPAAGKYVQENFSNSLTSLQSTQQLGFDLLEWGNTTISPQPLNNSRP